MKNSSLFEFKITTLNTFAFLNTNFADDILKVFIRFFYYHYYYYL